MRTLAIGDIHGCNTALESLLKSVQPAPGDRIVFLGDYIDRGPTSREVIETLLALDSSLPFAHLPAWESRSYGSRSEGRLI